MEIGCRFQVGKNIIGDLLHQKNKNHTTNMYTLNIHRS